MRTSGPSAFLTKYSKPISIPAFQRLFPHILALARSSPSIHTVVELFKAAVTRLQANESIAEEVKIQLQKARDEILSLPRTHKTAGGPHRATLYGMVASLGVPSNLDEGVSGLLTLMGTETASDAAEALSSMLATWIGSLLASDAPAKRAEEIGTSVAKGMGTKSTPATVGLRAAWWKLGATVLWGAKPVPAFVRPLMTPLDASLTTVGSGLTAKDDTLQEAVVAAASLLRIAGSAGELAQHVTGLASVRALVSPPAGDKTPWLFNERVYSRVGAPRQGVAADALAQEAVWCVRALDGFWTVSTVNST